MRRRTQKKKEEKIDLNDLVMKLGVKHKIYTKVMVDNSTNHKHDQL